MFQPYPTHLAALFIRVEDRHEYLWSYQLLIYHLLFVRREPTRWTNEFFPPINPIAQLKLPSSKEAIFIGTREWKKKTDIFIL